MGLSKKDMGRYSRQILLKMNNLQRQNLFDEKDIGLPKAQGSYQINIFKSRRAIIYGTNDEKTAKSLYAKYVGV